MLTSLFDSDAVRKYSTSGFGSLLHFNVSLSAADGLEKDGYLASIVASHGPQDATKRGRKFLQILK